ncbi:MAG: glutathione S-transferase family protein [Alphaproteobacteria bacterium]|nr:glutathione S-transferase family protein [Alphaproteobacteria bacterium]MDE2074536.1 glutathione S-transferase family protein [Alphaproteobacteria bacterium]MDE2350607.1 glutathione S-transferase family protein [Alphaproteobacteria bacterium]
MRRLTHLLLSPPSRFVRLLLGEKRLAYDSVTPEDPHAHLPVFEDADGTRCTGVWAIVDHLEGSYEDNPMVPEDPQPRAEALRLLDWAMGPLYESVTRKIVFEKAAQRVTGAPGSHAPSMETVRQGREALRPALKMLGETADLHGYLAARDCTLGDLAVAAHLSALDYFGEVPWKDFSSAAEWYLRMKSRPSFRALLSDRVPGQPPVSHYGQLDD